MRNPQRPATAATAPCSSHIVLHGLQSDPQIEVPPLHSSRDERTLVTLP